MSPSRQVCFKAIQRHISHSSSASNEVIEDDASENPNETPKIGRPPTPPRPKVAILWDLDNKPPLGAAADAVNALRRLAKQHGKIVQFSAMANSVGSAFLPTDVLERIEDRATAASLVAAFSSAACAGASASPTRIF